MFRGQVADYTERVDVIGNKAFISFVEDLENLEDMTLDTFEIGKEKLHILTIMPMPEKMDYDIGVPVLSPQYHNEKGTVTNSFHLPKRFL